MGLQVISAGGGTLFHLKLHEPDLRPIRLRRVAEENDLEQGFVGLELDGMMELGNERAKFFEKGHADLFEVLLGGAFGNRVRINSAEVWDVAIEPDGPGLGCDLPFGGAKENADVAAVNGGDTRGNGFGFERVIDGGEKNGVVGDVDDGAAAGEVGNDFVFLGGAGRAGKECQEKDKGGAKEEAIHEGRVAQRGESGAFPAGEMVPE
jgi:hypothetical protein